MDTDKHWKRKTMLLGAAVGSIAGLIAALMIIQRAEQQKSPPRLTAGDGIKLGLGILGVLRSLGEPGQKK